MSHDTWLHRVVRAPVRRLAPTRVRPNHLTTGRLLTGLAGASGFASQDPTWTVIGAALFVLSMLLDRADGELARLQRSSSRFGHAYDIVTDALVNAFVMVGIGIGSRGGALGDWAVMLGIVAGLAVAVVLVVMMRVEMRQGTGSATFGGIAGFDPDDAMLAIPIAMLFGWGEVILVAAALGAPLAAIAVTVHFRGRNVP